MRSIPARGSTQAALAEGLRAVSMLARGYGRENNCSIDFASSFVVALALVLSPDTAPQQFLQSLRDFVDFSVLTAGVPEH